MDRFVERAGHGVEPKGRAGADDLGDDRSLVGRRRALEEGAQILAMLAHPVGHEQELAMAHDRAFPAGHDIDPRRIFRLDPEFGVGGVLASDPGDAIIDDQRLAMIAQVDPAADHGPQIVPDRKRHPGLDPGGLEVAPVARANEAMRAQGIGEDPDLHPARGRADEGVLDLDAVIVVEPDVEAGVDRFLGRVGVGAHLVDRDIAVGGEGRRIALSRIEPVDGPGKRERPIMPASQAAVSSPPCRRAGGGGACRSPCRACAATR